MSGLIVVSHTCDGMVSFLLPFGIFSDVYVPVFALLFRHHGIFLGIREIAIKCCEYALKNNNDVERI